MEKTIVVFELLEAYCIQPELMFCEMSSTEPHFIAAPNEYRLNNPPSDGITSVHFAPNSSKHLLVSSWDCSVRLYELSSASTNFVLSSYNHNAAVLDCLFIDANRCCSCGLDKFVKFYDFENHCEAILGAHEMPVRCLSYNQNHGLVVSGSWDKTIKIWDYRVGRCIGCYNQPERVYTMDVCGDRLIVGTAMRKVWLWNFRNFSVGPEQQRESSLKYQTRCIKSFPDTEGFVMSSIEGRIAVEFIDPDPEVQKRKYAFKYGYVNIWDPFIKKRLSQYHKYPSSIISLDFSSDGDSLAIASSYQYEYLDKGLVVPEDCIYIRKVTEADTRQIGFPDLPSWLHVTHSPVTYDLFIFGNPESNITENIMVVALNLKTFQTARKRMRIKVTKGIYAKDDRVETAELWILNHNVWQFFADENILRLLQSLVMKAFPSLKEHTTILKLSIPKFAVNKALADKHDGTVVTMVAPGGFQKNVLNLMKELQANPAACKRNEIVSLNPVFAPRFQIDWCRLRLHEQPLSLTKNGTNSRVLIGHNELFGAAWTNDTMHEYITSSDNVRYRPTSTNRLGRSYFQDWIFFVVIPSAVLLFILLILSMMLFGCREGQHWRDYKTPRTQLIDYVHLRQSQQQLRQLSFRRHSSELVNLPSSKLIAKPICKQTVAEVATLKGSDLNVHFIENGAMKSLAHTGQHPSAQFTYLLLQIIA
ncbi:Mitotic checkpoint protein BUB3 [Trichinella nelsoni]|uniref:Mitotic checkpoint protein BUB3 n=1 Tax=Trichinella nelsoni TaxID=6336 RepID=A0A0V0S786_9BILA|nr:Mitotic checkpoint protein BUB3 [Trichinella nelsoni]